MWLENDGGEGPLGCLCSLRLLVLRPKLRRRRRPSCHYFLQTASSPASSPSLLILHSSFCCSQNLPAATMSNLPPVYIVSSARTPLGQFQGFVVLPTIRYCLIADSPPALWAA